MQTLIVGGGGREHALAWKLAQSEQVDTVYVAPGNAGTANAGKLNNIPIGAEDIQALVRFAKQEKIALTIVGPEAPLIAGIVDAFQTAGLVCFGPTRNAARLEGSKAFAKDFLKRYRIPTADYAVFTRVEAAVEYIQAKTTPIVIKADGLAAGKGVIIAATPNEAVQAVQDLLTGNTLGAAGHRVVIEEFIAGEEISFIVITDGEHVLPLASSQDHKARDEGNQGPNTGGMGACSPAPAVDAAMQQRIMDTIILPTVKGMAREDRLYRGCLYAGLMITPDRTPKVLEFNCRFGDPETQALMPRLKTDLAPICLAATTGGLDRHRAEWDARAAIAVVAAAAGYPAATRKGEVIHGLDSDFPAAVKLFHAGTASSANQIVTAGGRVLCVTGLGETIAQAQQLTYQAITAIHYEGMFYRKDIGCQAVQHR